jgi:hypothetical protein
MPQRGKLLVKICDRTECRPELRPSRKGELADAHLHGAVRPVDPHVDVERERVVAPGHVPQAVRHAVVVLGVDDLLLLPGAPRVRAGGGQQHAAVGGQAEQPRARLALALRRLGEALALARADLDLRLDQLSGNGFGQHGVRRRRLLQLVEPLVERQRLRVEDRELLLDSDREVRRGLERLMDAGHFQHQVR